jgi:hypothetical protein
MNKVLIYVFWYKPDVVERLDLDSTMPLTANKCMLRNVIKSSGLGEILKFTNKWSALYFILIRNSFCHRKIRTQNERIWKQRLEKNIWILGSDLRMDNSVHLGAWQFVLVICCGDESCTVRLMWHVASEGKTKHAYKIFVEKFEVKPLVWRLWQMEGKYWKVPYINRTRFKWLLRWPFF